ncbi:hypothetical protein A2960_06100 [Candidatus Gottesmanbacteria bacterium RIFCSPLOWO2_01_FULL_39_12b]|uniref:Polymerase nucleotidyl transferase domain-containing protein n=1 Tax=Candidatus Gottesmanbacteria bacterium RIFCSPLOWO2_01_FULL_39_12b TaxID=1798388 RepID=A0A1F6APJ7_9BACT|nr:MAG: hypothetical protein A2960_06100 [Candidatus Gottesmanbacteria bacterium RIFCSPLOWO2_01_FULL_39_12b]
MRDIQEEAKLLAAKIVNYCRPQKIILFGSVARNEKDNDSDIDFLIVKESEKKRPFRIKEVFEALRGVERNYPLDVIVYTPSELEKRLFLGDYFIKRILTEGKVIYGQE